MKYKKSFALFALITITLTLTSCNKRDDSNVDGAAEKLDRAYRARKLKAIAEHCSNPPGVFVPSANTVKQADGLSDRDFQVAFKEIKKIDFKKYPNRDFKEILIANSAMFADTRDDLSLVVGDKLRRADVESLIERQRSFGDELTKDRCFAAIEIPRLEEEISKASGYEIGREDRLYIQLLRALKGLLTLQSVDWSKIPRKNFSSILVFDKGKASSQTDWEHDILSGQLKGILWLHVDLSASQMTDKIKAQSNLTSLETKSIQEREQRISELSERLNTISRVTFSTTDLTTDSQREEYFACLQSAGRLSRQFLKSGINPRIHVVYFNTYRNLSPSKSWITLACPDDQYSLERLLK